MFSSSSPQGESDRDNFERIAEAIRSSKKVRQTAWGDALCGMAWAPGGRRTGFQTHTHTLTLPDRERQSVCLQRTRSKGHLWRNGRRFWGA